jgi:hypothetical protein
VGDSDGDRDDRLRHRIGDEPLGRRAVVLVPFDLDHAILNDHQAHDALARHVIIHRQSFALVELPFDGRLMLGARQGHRRRARRQHIRLATEDAFDFSLRGKGSNPHRLVVEPVLRGADRVALGLAQFVFVRPGGGLGSDCR